MTLKFKAKDTYCDRHKISLKKLNKNIFSRFLPKSNSTIDLKNNLVESQLNGAQTNRHHHQKSLNDDQNNLDDINSTCIACLAENNKFGQIALTTEQLYNQQPTLMFKYYIGMCFLVFISIAAVLLISDLKKFLKNLIFFF